ncbi:D-alanyl-D-alanine dipeptidase [Candidatus Kaiserbacteria bacterium]|nr:D-alanyl-D-alanine dipeptidase [Candidatus Kaiserbacteria bacterium]
MGAIVSIRNLGEPLADLGAYDFVLEPVYFKEGLTTEPRMFLRKSVAKKLLKIQKGLEIYKFKIWDGYRTRAVQAKLYERFWNELKQQHPEWRDEKLKMEVDPFVADPRDPEKTPAHTTGSTVDLTLVDVNGKELDMGTPFDYFGPEASSLYFEEHAGHPVIKENRKLLRDAMRAEGFSSHKEEWWHFDYGNQKWALALGKSEAFFGEVEMPE